MAGQVKKSYPTSADKYELYEEVGQGASASVYRALCIQFNEIVAVKVLDLEKHNDDLSNISNEIKAMNLFEHENVLGAHCSFVNGQMLWVVMPYMAGGSCLNILKVAYPDGFVKESIIATFLHSVLKGLAYLHNQGIIHRDVKAGNILVDAHGGVKLGDLGVSAYLYNSGDRQRTRNTFVGTPCWIAPEVLKQHGYDCKADIWSFGITSLELAHGHAPFSEDPPMTVLLRTLNGAPPTLDNTKHRKFSKSFSQMVSMCLDKDPYKRATADKLLKHPFFKKARSKSYIVHDILDGLPPLGDRVKALKMKEQFELAKKLMPDGKEELSQSEYKKGISGWDFDTEDLKIQASLIEDGEGNTTEIDAGGCTNSPLACSTFQDSGSLSMFAGCSSTDDIEKERINMMHGEPTSPIVTVQVSTNQRLERNVWSSDISSGTGHLLVHSNNLDMGCLLFHLALSFEVLEVVNL